MTKYIPCTPDQVRAHVRFHTPQRNAGQVIEIAYAIDNPVARSEADDGDAYKCITDHSVGVGSPGRVTFYRREDVAPYRWAVMDIRGETNYGKVASLHDTENAANNQCRYLARTVIQRDRNAITSLMWEVRQVMPNVAIGERLRRTGRRS